MHELRAARALLHIEQAELASRAHVSVATIRRIEAANGEDSVSPTTVDAVRRALEAAGAEFIPGGVRRRQPTRPDAARLFEELRAISQRSAARLADRDILTDADLYDEDGLPA